MVDQRTLARPGNGGNGNHEEQRDGQRSAALRDWPAREAVDPQEDKLSLPPSVVPPDGFVYERKRYSCLGKLDLAHWNRMLRGGWRPVAPKRHPEIAADPDSPAGMIMQDGLVLCERPEAYTAEARREERLRAGMQMGIQLSRIGHAGDGEAPRVTSGQNLGFKQDYALQVDPSKVPIE